MVLVRVVVAKGIRRRQRGRLAVHLLPLRQEVLAPGHIDVRVVGDRNYSALVDLGPRGWGRSLGFG